MAPFSRKLLSGLAMGCMLSSLEALPLGNPADPILYTQGWILDPCSDPCNPSWFDSLSVRIGYYGDFVFERHLKRDSHGLHGDIEHTRLFTNAGLLALNFCDRVDVFTTLGATHGRIETQSDFATESGRPREELELGTNFSWSLGGRAVIWECGCTTFGIEGQYFHTNLNVVRVTDAASVTSFPSGVRAKYSEWQIGMGMAYRVNILVPYIGVKWAKAYADLDNAIVLGHILPNLEGNKHWGFVTGVSLIDCDMAGLTVEGRFGDEKAIHVNGQIRF